MKTILKDNQYLRVNNEVAEHEVRMGRAKYTSKIDWKKNVRNAVKAEDAVEAEKKGEHTKSKKAIKAFKFKTKKHQ
jgi:hypothetical protein